MAPISKHGSLPKMSRSLTTHSPHSKPKVPQIRRSVDSVPTTATIRESEPPLTPTSQLRIVDDTMAEVMESIESMESKAPPTRNTPDLVQDLPDHQIDDSPVGSFNESIMSKSSVSAAENFAKDDSATMVRMKSSSMPRSANLLSAAAAGNQLSSFKRSASTSAAISNKEGRPVAVTQPMPKIDSATGIAPEGQSATLPSAGSKKPLPPTPKQKPKPPPPELKPKPKRGDGSTQMWTPAAICKTV